MEWDYNPLNIYIYIYIYIYVCLVGGAITILKHMSSSIGRMTSHIWNKKNNVPNHQPDMEFNGGFPKSWGYPKSRKLEPALKRVTWDPPSLQKPPSGCRFLHHVAGFSHFLLPWKIWKTRWIVGGLNLPLWKIMGLKSVGMMTFPIWWEN